MKRNVLAEIWLFLGVGIALLMPLIVLVLFSMRTQHFDHPFDLDEVRILLANLIAPPPPDTSWWSQMGMIGFAAFLTSLVLGLSAALWMSEYTPKNTRRWLRNYIGVQAAVPAGIYGLGVLLLMGRVPVGEGEGLFRLYLIFVLMTVPLCTILMEDALRNVPRSLRNAAYALGATKVQTAFRVVLPDSSNRIIKGGLLALTRVLGEVALVTITVGIVQDIGLCALLMLGQTFVLNLFFILTKSS
jgi:phosphate transport system permease protein